MVLLYPTHLVGTRERVVGTIGEFEDEVAFLVEVEDAAKDLAGRGLGADLFAEKPAPFADFGHSGAEVVVETLKFGVQGFQHPGCERVAVDLVDEW